MFESNVPPTLNPTLNLIDNINKSRHIWKSNQAVLACFYKSFLPCNFMGFLVVSAGTRWATEQVYSYRKAIHVELNVWCELQNVLVSKLFTSILNQNIVLFKEPHKNKSLLIDNLPL